MNLELQFKSIIQSEDKYPVDFDKAWKWAGYSRKDSAKRTLIKSFISTNDFTIHIKEDSSKKYGKKKETIYLTKDCFKEFCMLAETEKGREVRQYFLKVEKEFYRLKEFSTAKENTKLKESRKKNISLFHRSGLNNPEQYRDVTRRQTQIVTGLTPTQLKESRNPKAKTGRELLTEREQIGMLIEENLTMLNILDDSPNDFSGVMNCIEKTVPDMKRIYYKNENFVRELEKLRA
ncbi:MAG: hypothetical protein L6Q54_11440 [Leptospiraceae bacterium]|nr:hypothetical protein [Leptospiraceae bacterium]MCK6381841.1 hypothetical protein [Leptospiraceae bacterium]NUM42604.1 hypothetical protein [Leptospiraceae bacterium]